MPITLEQFSAGLDKLRAVFPRQMALTDEQLVIWTENLADLDPDQWERAVSTAIREGDDWPTIAKLRRYGLGGVGLEDRAAAAWNELRDAITLHGGHESVEFEDPVIAATVRAMFGGWVELCEQPAGGLDDAFVQGQWIKTYCRLCRGGITRRQAAPFAGYLDRDAGRVTTPKRIETALGAHEGLRIAGPEQQRIGEVPKSVSKRATAAAVEAFVEKLEADKVESEEQRAADVEAITVTENERKSAAVQQFRKAVES